MTYNDGTQTTPHKINSSVSAIAGGCAGAERDARAIERNRDGRLDSEPATYTDSIIRRACGAGMDGVLPGLRVQRNQRHAWHGGRIRGQVS